MAALNLDTIGIATPCRESWDEMDGDDRTRHCEKCALNVFNISDMTREEAEDLIKEANGRVCVRLFRRQDGTVITKDCPVGVRMKWFQRFRVAALFAVLLSGVVVVMKALTTKETYAAPIDLNSIKTHVVDPAVNSVIETVTPQNQIELMGDVDIPVEMGEIEACE